MKIKQTAAISREYDKLNGIQNLSTFKPLSLVNVVTDGHPELCPTLFFVCLRAAHYFTSLSTTIFKNVL